MPESLSWPNIIQLMLCDYLVQKGFLVGALCLHTMPVSEHSGDNSALLLGKGHHCLPRKRDESKAQGCLESTALVHDEFSQAVSPKHISITVKSVLVRG